MSSTIETFQHDTYDLEGLIQDAIDASKNRIFLEETIDYQDLLTRPPDQIKSLLNTLFEQSTLNNTCIRFDNLDYFVNKMQKNADCNHQMHSCYRKYSDIIQKMVAINSNFNRTDYPDMIFRLV